jgi:DNA-binding XRE family transcriptional regulator
MKKLLDNATDIGVAEAIAKPELDLNNEQEMIFNYWVEMPSEKREVLWPMFQAFDKSKCAEDKASILEAIKECMFRPIWDNAATHLDKVDVSNMKLDQHKKYVGEQIKLRRLALSLSQDELASLAGLPQPHICRLEKGKHTATYLTIQKLAKALKTSPKMLDPGFDH